MTRFQRLAAPFNTFPALRFLGWLPVFAALAGVATPGDAEAATRRAGAYDGTWNVVFATKRGNCSSGYSVPFNVTGSRISSAGGGQVSGSVNRAGAVAVNVSVGDPRPPAVAASPAPMAQAHGAASSPATVAAGPGRPREADLAVRGPGEAKRNPGARRVGGFDRSRIALRSIRLREN